MPEHQSGGAAAGGALFAGVMMILIGVFQGFSGLAAVLGDNIYAQTPNVSVTLDVSTWGWVHLILGALVALVGLAILAGSGWARVVGIILVALAALGNFMSIPSYPVWHLLLVALDVFVIWALAVWRPEEIS